MSGAYDEALERFRCTGPFYGRFGNGPGFANHGPMVAEALDQLGRSAEIDAWSARYAPLLNERPIEREPIAAEAWAAALGQWQRAGDWLAFFERELLERSWVGAVRTWLPRLLPGPDLLGHGPIRLFHILRALAVEQTDVRIREVADALAYWAMAFDFSFRLEPDLAPSGPDLERALDDVILESAWAYVARPDVRPIVLTHAVTVPRAMRELLPWLTPEARPGAVDIAISLARQIRAPYLAPWPDVSPEQPNRAALIEQACVSGDDHAIKLTEACLRQYARQPQPVFLAVADDITHRLQLPA